MARVRQPAPWLLRAAYKYALIRRDPDYPRLLRLWTENLSALPRSPAWGAREAANRAMCQKYQVAIPHVNVLRESAETERLDAGTPGRVTKLLNHEWPLVFTINGGVFPPQLGQAIRPPGDRGVYFGPWLAPTLGVGARLPGRFYVTFPGEPDVVEGRAPVVWGLRLDVDLARVTYRDIRDVAEEFRVLLRRCYPYAARFPRGAPRSRASLLVCLDQSRGVALPDFLPSPSPRALSVALNLASVTTRDFRRLAREFRGVLRQHVPRGGTRAGDPLAWLHTANPRDVARHFGASTCTWSTV